MPEMTWADFKGSEHFSEIRRIIGSANRRDALHVDSAYKTGCVAMVTVDGDILDHKTEIEKLLPLIIFHPVNDDRRLMRLSSIAWHVKASLGAGRKNIYGK